MSDKFYKIGNTWYPWQTAHGLYGYTKTPTIRITYISTSQATWGQPESGYGFFDGDASEPQDGSYFHTSTWGWFDADTMAKTVWLMPSECEIDDIFFENDGDISPGARLVIDPSVSIDEEDWRYLIASVRNLGWHTLDEWEELGWVLSDPNTLYFGGDFSGNNIRMESVDGGGGLIDKYASYKPLFELRGWEPGGLFIDKPRMMGICGVLIETSDSVVLVEVPKQLSVGHIEFTGSLAEGGIPESGVVYKGTILPTVSTENDFGNYNWVTPYSGGAGSISMQSGEIKNAYYGGSQQIVYSSTKSYGVIQWQSEPGTNSGSIEVSVVENSTLVALKNVSSNTISIAQARVAVCSSNAAEIVTVYDNQNTPFNAFKYNDGTTDYYYVLDDTQTDWTDALSSIGYHLPPTNPSVYFTSQGSAATDNYRFVGNTMTYVYDAAGSWIQYDSSKTYTKIAIYNKEGVQLSGDFVNGIKFANNSGWLCVVRNYSSDVAYIFRIEYTET